MSQADIENAIASLRRALRKTIYGVLVAVLAALLVGVGNVAYTNSVDGRRRAEVAQQAAARAQVQEQTRQLVCQLAIAQADAFSDATSAAGQKSLAAWRAMTERFHCS